MMDEGGNGEKNGDGGSALNQEVSNLVVAIEL
jgi:hypothetical protein